MYFIILFYQIFEEWSKNCGGEDMIIKQSVAFSTTFSTNDICECQRETYQSAFGTNEISIKLPEGPGDTSVSGAAEDPTMDDALPIAEYHHWKLKLLKFVPNTKAGQAWCRLMIGIFNADLAITRCDTFFSFGEYEYIWNCDRHYGRGDDIISVLGSEIYHRQETKKLYGDVAKTGDVIDIYVDCEKRTVSFSINDIDYGVAFKDVKQGKYRLAVCLTGIGTSIQILSYDEIKV